MEAVETNQRRRNTKTNGGKGFRKMGDNVTRTETETQEDDNGGGVDAEYWGLQTSSAVNTLVYNHVRGYVGQQG